MTLSSHRPEWGESGGNGGTGGAGGSAEVGPGGDGGEVGAGGNGGLAEGGFVFVGMSSGTQALANDLGLADYGSVLADASATGGNGGGGGSAGSGGFGTPLGADGTDGIGGNGGSANGGTAFLQARGSLVEVDFAELIANATGGDGGSGAVQGAGGDAESDEIVVLVESRIGNPAQRGQLNAGTIIGTVNSVGGNGSTIGTGFAEGGSSFIVRDSDATIGSVHISVVARLPDCRPGAGNHLGHQWRCDHHQ